jgi:hypothetical protein
VCTYQETNVSFSFSSWFAFLLFLLEGIFGGLILRILLPRFLQIINVQLPFIPDIELCNPQKIIDRNGLVELDRLLDIHPWSKTLLDHMLFHPFVRSSYLHHFFIETLKVVSERLVLSLHYSLKRNNCFQLCL